MARVLLVDDDRRLLSLLERGFRFEGFEVVAAHDGEAAAAAASAARPDVVILDVGMPGRDGFAVCRDLRRDLDVPVIMLTARDEVGDKVRALDLGADDYVTKPFAFDELVARVRAVLRRRGSDPTPRVTFADVIFDIATREVTRAGRLVALTAREFDLLLHFMRHPHQVFSRDTILSAVWGDSFEGDAKVVDVYVGYLRQKLGEPWILQTIRGVGYVLKE
jgi:DNA-binding response OmpR family regulator